MQSAQKSGSNDITNAHTHERNTSHNYQTSSPPPTSSQFVPANTRLNQVPYGQTSFDANSKSNIYAPTYQPIQMPFSGNVIAMVQPGQYNSNNMPPSQAMQQSVMRHPSPGPSPPPKMPRRPSAASSGSYT